MVLRDTMFGHIRGGQATSRAVPQSGNTPVNTNPKIDPIFMADLMDNNILVLSPHYVSLDLSVQVYEMEERRRWTLL